MAIDWLQKGRVSAPIDDDFFIPELCLPEALLGLVLLAELLVLVLVLAERLQRIVGPRVLQAFERLMGLILVALAVEMLLRGAKLFAQQL